jgi:hypothetical protein
MVVARPFKKFLKALAWIVGKQIWYKACAASITADFLLAVLATYNFPQIALDEIRSLLREKKPSKPKKAKPAKSVVTEGDVSKAVDAAASVVSTSGATQAGAATQPNNVATQPSASSLAPVDDADKLAAELLNLE